MDQFTQLALIALDILMRNHYGTQCWWISVRKVSHCFWEIQFHVTMVVSVIPVLLKLRQEDDTFKASLSYIRPFRAKTKKNFFPVLPLNMGLVGKGAACDPAADGDSLPLLLPWCTIWTSHVWHSVNHLVPLGHWLSKGPGSALRISPVPCWVLSPRVSGSMGVTWPPALASLTDLCNSLSSLSSRSHRTTAWMSNVSKIRTDQKSITPSGFLLLSRMECKFTIRDKNLDPWLSFILNLWRSPSTQCYGRMMVPQEMPT